MKQVLYPQATTAGSLVSMLGLLNAVTKVVTGCLQMTKDTIPNSNVLNRKTLFQLLI